MIWFLWKSIIWLGAAMFSVGSLMVVFGGAHEEWVTRGKHLIISSLLGIGVVGGAYVIYATTVCILYGGMFFTQTSGPGSECHLF